MEPRTDQERGIPRDELGEAIEAAAAAFPPMQDRVKRRLEAIAAGAADPDLDPRARRRAAVDNATALLAELSCNAQAPTFDRLVAELVGVAGRVVIAAAPGSATVLTDPGRLMLAQAATVPEAVELSVEAMRQALPLDIETRDDGFAVTTWDGQTWAFFSKREHAAAEEKAVRRRALSWGYNLRRDSDDPDEFDASYGLPVGVAGQLSRQLAEEIGPTSDAQTMEILAQAVEERRSGRSTIVLPEPWAERLS